MSLVHFIGLVLGVALALLILVFYISILHQDIQVTRRMVKRILDEIDKKPQLYESNDRYYVTHEEEVERAKELWSK